MAGSVLVGSFLAVLVIVHATALAQVMGPEAEMERLEIRAEEAMANGDPDGASMSIGKAALMASELAKREEGPSRVRRLRARERLFRAQEHAYRALALYERAGGQPPASSGVCGSLSLAAQQLEQSVTLLRAGDPGSPSVGSGDAGRDLKALADDWAFTIEDIRAEYQCPG